MFNASNFWVVTATIGFLFHRNRDSETDSSINESPPAKKALTVEKNGTKKQSKNSETDTDAKPITRKSTRSTNTRKSKHLTGNTTLELALSTNLRFYWNTFFFVHFFRPAAIFHPRSDDFSESETDRRAQSRSPVKRAKGKHPRPNSKLNAHMPKKMPPVIEERKCPLDGRLFT